MKTRFNQNDPTLRQLSSPSSGTLSSSKVQWLLDGMSESASIRIFVVKVRSLRHSTSQPKNWYCSLDKCFKHQERVCNQNVFDFPRRKQKLFVDNHFLYLTLIQNGHHHENTFVYWIVVTWKLTKSERKSLSPVHMQGRGESGASEHLTISFMREGNTATIHLFI